MTEKIMQDNIMYLQEWMRYNPSIQKEIIIDKEDICCQINGKMERQNISHFYLPDMLYNENLRAAIPFEEEISGVHLFQIIKLYCQTKEILESEQRELQQYPKICDIKVLKDENDQEFLLLVDEYKKKYRFDTEKPESIINLYNDLKEKQGNVTLKELGRMIKNGMY